MNKRHKRNFHKVFAIGLDTKAATSLHSQFLSLGLDSHHGEKWWVANDYSLLSAHDCFSGGFPSNNLEKLDKLFPASKFILQVCALDGWVYHRLAEMGTGQQRDILKSKANWRKTKKLIKQWIMERNDYHLQTLEYFAQDSEDFMVINLAKDTSAQQKIAAFLGYKDEDIGLEKHVISGIEAAISEKYTPILEECIQEMGLPREELQFDLYCPSLLDSGGSSFPADSRWLESKQDTLPADMSKDAVEPMVSCMCVTYNRIDLLQRAVGCFQRQTWRNRELIILYESDDHATRNYVATLQDPMIRSIEVSAIPKLTLGMLRNRAIKAARGTYVAQWDDDDWYAPERLEKQMEAIKASGRPACVLKRWTIFMGLTSQAYLSKPRAWEGSVVVRRSVLPAYPGLARSEDTPVIEALEKAEKLVFLDMPQLYVYTYHGDNTWDSNHWTDRVLYQAQPLSDEVSRQVAQMLTANQ